MWLLSEAKSNNYLGGGDDGFKCSNDFIHRRPTQGEHTVQKSGVLSECVSVLWKWASAFMR
jgi:hypothetical protein